MSKKVLLAIFDRDLKAREYKTFDVSKDGSKINVRQGGSGNFKPTFDNDSFIELPRPWYLGGGWKRVYFARNGAKACVRFRKKPNDLSNKIKTIADLEEVINAASAESPNPEAIHDLNELLQVIETAGEDDYLKQDPEQIKDAARSEMIRNFGKQQQQTTWKDYILIFLMILIFLKVFGVIV